MYQLRPYQQKAVDFAVPRLKTSKKPLLMCLGTGCHAKGSPILMADGTTKPAEEIKVGDMLMGADEPKMVLKLHQGIDEMYRIVPTKGKPFIVNGGHILHIQQYTRNRRNGEDVYGKIEQDISVYEYLQQTAKFKHCAKLIYGSYSYGETPKLPCSAWVIGAYLGDGLTFTQGERDTTFFNVDKPVIEKMRAECETSGWGLKTSEKDPTRHSILTYKQGKTSPFKSMMFKIGAMDKKELRKKFPAQALSWEMTDRARLLAGLLDTDGSYDGKSFDFISKYEDIARGAMLLARSLGLGATIRTKRVKLETWEEPRAYYRVCISGHGIEMLPCVKHHLQVNQQKKQQNVTGFKVEHIGKDEYYGFEVDGDHLYLDGEMVIQHNSGKSWIIAEIAKQWKGKILVLTLSKELCEQDYAKMQTVVGEGVGMYSASWGKKEIEQITVATVQSAYKHPELWEDYSLIIGDEIDNLPIDGMLGKVLGDKKIVGLTATPYSTIGSHKGSWYTTKIWPMHKIKSKTFGWFWQPVEFNLSEKELIKQGYLSPMKLYSSPIACHILKLASNGSEYTPESIEAWVKRIYDRIIEVMQGAEKTWQSKSGIVFMPSVESCIILEKMCAEMGVDARAVHYQTPAEERDKIIGAHKQGELKWLINQGVATRGFDNPMVDCLVIARPTRSLRLHRQILGRGLRLAEGKELCNVIDLTENCRTWGGPEDVEMGQTRVYGHPCDQILLRGKDIAGMETGKINLRRKKEVNYGSDYQGW